MGLRSESLGPRVLKDLGRLYAVRLLNNSRLFPEHMEDLTRREGWKKASVQRQKEIADFIKEHAREKLLESGYSADIVNTVLPLQSRDEGGGYE